MSKKTNCSAVSRQLDFNGLREPGGFGFDGQTPVIRKRHHVILPLQVTAKALVRQRHNPIRLDASVRELQPGQSASYRQRSEVQPDAPCLVLEMRAHDTR
jgi:hypothetical protein